MVETTNEPTHSDSTMDAAICQSIVYFHIYQDGLMWGRLQTLGLIQAATIGSEYALKTSSRALVIVVAVFGAALSALLLKIVQLDQKYRDINLPMLGRILEKHSMPNLTFTEPSGIGWGGLLLKGIILLFAVVDLTLGVLWIS
jgi:hypothetical protein